MANRNVQQQRPNGGGVPGAGTGGGVTSAQNKICQFKLVLLGESAVGKSSLVLRFVKGQFHEYQESTIGGMFEFMFDSFLLIFNFFVINCSLLFSRILDANSFAG